MLGHLWGAPVKINFKLKTRTEWTKEVDEVPLFKPHALTNGLAEALPRFFETFFALKQKPVDFSGGVELTLAELPPTVAMEIESVEMVITYKEL